ncbi:sugar transferase [Peribacillus kribbensis]|uniref:sugar transferase n=1 Tax=Peribacillus kribbensis TaxID=356658 RepID=UPI0003FEA55A|nr:sugar transferase [Peribacillus kribbensis]
MKRVFDLLFSALLLLILLPFIFLIACVVKIGLGSPVVYKQQRPGLNGKPFYLFKYRTMNNKCNANGELLPDHQRLTALGKFLRKYSLDELLQLINVLKGDISLVGPRPLLMEYLPLYTTEQFKRHNVRPGITGWAQINGRNAISWEEKFLLDLWYVENYSFLLDMKILKTTFIKVIKTEGIQQKDDVPMEKFKGSSSHMKEGRR